MTEQRVIPMLAYEDAGRAADWITKIFGFKEIERFHNGAGTVTDVVLDLDGATVLVGQTPSYGEGVTFAPLVELLSQAAGRPSGPGRRQTHQGPGPSRSAKRRGINHLIRRLVGGRESPAPPPSTPGE